MSSSLAQAESGLSADIDAVRGARHAASPRARALRLPCAQMFVSQGAATPAAPAQPLAPPSANGTLDESVSDTLKRDAFRCAALRSARAPRAGAHATRGATATAGSRATCAPCCFQASGAQPAPRCARRRPPRSARSAVEAPWHERDARRSNPLLTPRALRRRCGTGTSGGRSSSP